MLDALSEKYGHVPVLGREAVEALAPKEGGIYIDATLGGGGYTRLLLNSTACQVIAFDRDPAAIAAAKEWEGQFGGRLTLVQRPFSEIEEALQELGVERVDGVVFDLGVSSVQLDEAERGFSFAKEGPLNMRMDQASEFDAAALVNNAEEKDLADIFYIYGEEKKSRVVARAIVKAREAEEITTTQHLASIVVEAVGQRANEKIHPATRVFQAIRIFVNDELGQLFKGLIAAEAALGEGGLLSVVTFHSLEDRMVKRFLAKRSAKEAAVSRHLPDAGVQNDPTFELLSRKAVIPSQEERESNPRARSAKLRIGRRLAATPPFVDRDFCRAIGYPQPTFSKRLNNWS